MATSERYAELADTIVDLLGGKDNISFFGHCMTRLRFNVKDTGIVKVDEIEKLPGVMGCKWAGGQLQVIIGQAVSDAYALIAERNGLEKQEAVAEDGADAPDASGTGKKKFSINTVFDVISGSITPLIPVLIGTGFIKIIVLLCEQLGVLSAGMPRIRCYRSWATRASISCPSTWEVWLPRNSAPIRASACSWAPCSSILISSPR